MPLLWLSLAFLVGIVVGSQAGWSLAAWLGLAGAALALDLALRLAMRRWPSLDVLRQARRLFTGHLWPSLPLVIPSFSLILIAFALGAARYQGERLEIGRSSLAAYNGQGKFVVEGVLAAPPDERDEYYNLRVQVERLHPEGELLFQPVEGLLLARVPPVGKWRYGDRLQLEGYLQAPPEFEGFSYREYLARQGIYSYLSCGPVRESCARLLGDGQANRLLMGLYSLHDRAQQAVYRLWPDPEASLAAGILLGEENSISEEVYQAFRDTGTAHIIVISGFNITILAGLFSTIFLRLLGRPRRFLAAGLTALAVAVYTLFVGAYAAVVRAAILGGLALFARQLGRRQHGLNSLAIIAALMALADPDVLWDIGFQLSFMATLGLVVFANPFARAFEKLVSRFVPTAAAQKASGLAGEYLLYTLAAQMTTMPVILYYFNRMPVASIPANLLILPAQPLLMILGGLAILIGLVVFPLGRLAAALAMPFLSYTIRSVEWLADWPFATISIGSFGLLALGSYYVVLFGWMLWGKQFQHWLASPAGGRLCMPATFQAVVLVSLVALTFFSWQAAFYAPDGRLHLWILEVGNGEGLLIQTPGGRYVLINGGSSPSRLSDGLGRRMPWSFRRIDYLIVAGAGDERLGALPRLLERFAVENVLWSGSTAGSASAREMRKLLAESGVPSEFARAGQTLSLGEGAVLRVLAVGSRGSVMLLEWKNFRVLLPIGLDFNNLEALQADPSLRHVTALLLSESGYAPLNPPEWVAFLRPQVVLLSVAADDWQGRPEAETLEAIAGYPVLRTDLNGWIELSTDGQQIWVEVERR